MHRSLLLLLRRAGAAMLTAGLIATGSAVHLPPAPALAAAPPTNAAPSLPLTDCAIEVGIGDAKTPAPARCGTLNVPEDRAKPDGRQVTLAVVVLPPTDPGAKGLPIFHLEGGPGGSAISNFGQGWFIAYDELRRQHPVVLVDQRGVGQSTSLQCTEITDSALSDLKAAQSLNLVALLRYGACATRLSKTTDPRQYTSAAAADDLDAVRAALGYDRILIFSNSYGTWLAQFYLKAYGPRVAGMILDSVVGPWNQPELDAPANAQAALDGVIALCKADATCAKTYPDLPGKLKTAIARLDKQPFTVTGTSTISGKGYPVVMTADRLRESLFQMLYSVTNAELIPQTIADAAEGIYTFPAALQASQAELSGDFVSIGLNLSVSCAETSPYFSESAVTAKQKPSFLYPTPEAYALAMRAQAAICAIWPHAPLKRADVAPVRSSQPVLIFSGALDPVTPIRYGEETHARLSRSTLVTFPNQAHGVLITSQCARTLAAAFFADPTAKLNTACAANELAPIFTGAYNAEFELYDEAGATFTGYAPKGWASVIDGPLTFFTSPDKRQFAAAGVYRNMRVKDARAALLAAIEARYGATHVQQEVTQSLLIISVTAVVHSLNRPDYAYMGAFYLRPDGKDVLVVWNAAPSMWFQAVSLAYAPQMLATMHGR